MIRLLFVGDGERDAAMNPPLVKAITGAPIGPVSTPWPRLNQAGKGYDRKLLFAIRQARQAGLQGVVATVDRDRSSGSDRLRSMVAAREKDRGISPALPAALGCAAPHAEVWLLDDPVAVREILKLEPEADVPNVRKVKNPKEELRRLQSTSPRRGESPTTIVAEIAAALRPQRCQHSKETGFAGFVDEVATEIAPLAR